MAGVWKPAKTRCRFPPVSTPPWESGKRRRIPTFPPRRRRLSSTKQKIKKTKGSRPLRGLQIRIYFRITLHWKRYRVSGSSEDWKMLDPYRSALATITSMVDNQKLTEFKLWFGRCQFFRINPFYMGPRAEGERYEPSLDLSNFAEWYRHLLQTRQK